ncbi:hypothetical protein BDF20DRAFT_84429 [Mycotypha africana]|uniref:uncharacterized protein n=1 Tax=Mycotypha africana TaxID=64632 RepID=UPI0023014877|nr:uncharacterized protein BDF20DRAFT_84429 [Mycotypha africana]KAI8992059.1 hypothetical protein BDF20DRAFT_84429 [Mycotypha africana]
MKLKSIVSVLLSLIVHNTLAEVNRDFERRHMHEAHQIEINDEVAFFKIHDLNKDGFWDENELRSMYGLERDIDPNAQHVQMIIEKVYEKMDLNRDRFISQDEYILATLPDFNGNAKKKEDIATSATETTVQKKRNIANNESKNKQKRGNSNDKSKKKAEGVIPDKFKA